MKRWMLVAPLSLCVLLVACGGSSTAEATCKEKYWDGEVGTCIAEGWEIIDGETLRQRGVPSETIAAFQMATSVSGQFPTVAVTREQLSAPAKAGDYSAASVRAVEVLPGYKLIDLKDMTIDGSSVRLHIFSAQPLGDEPMRRFYQVSITPDDGDVGYTTTAVTPMSIGSDVESQVMVVLNSLTFKEPVATE